MITEAGDNYAQAGQIQEDFHITAGRWQKRQDRISRLQSKTGSPAAQALKAAAAGLAASDEARVFQLADQYNGLRGQDAAIPPLLEEDDTEQLRQLRWKLRSKQLEGGRIRTLLKHDRVGPVATARSGRLDDIEAEIKHLTGLIRRIESACPAEVGQQ